jgi:hypothetical protein
MKRLTNPSNFTFTNHFNQSLLKSRIAMMNRRKSPWIATLKYGVFIGMLWVCAAFTKPYRAEVAAKIVEKMPELEAVLQPKVIEKPALNDFVWEKPQFDSVKQADSTKVTLVLNNAMAEADTQQWVSSTKYVVYKGNYLHFLITAKTTFEDLVKIRQELDRHGLGLEVMAWQMDSLGRYVRKVEVLVKSFSGSPRLIARGNDTESKPIKPIAVMLPLTKIRSNGVMVSMSWGDTEVQILKELARLDTELAYFDVRWSQSVYEVVSRYRQKGFYSVPIVFFSSKSLVKEDTPLFRHPFAILTDSDNKEILKVNASLRKAKFRLNDNPALLADIESIPPDKFIKAVKYEVDDKKTNFHEIYMLVYTKP